MRDDENPAEEIDAGPDDYFEEAQPGEIDASVSASLLDEVFALVDDGRTYAEAEVTYQKTRLTYTAGESKSVALAVLAAIGFVHLALIALVVGFIIALSPYLTALGATFAAVAVLLFATFIALLVARRRARNIADAFKEEE